MQKYGNGADESGVVGFETGPGSITLEFSGGDRYLYTDESAGAATIAALQALAKAGRGLSAFLATDVRARYSEQSNSSGSGKAANVNTSSAPTLTNVLIDTKLLEKALIATRASSNRDVVENALQTLIHLAAQQELMKMRGTVEWVGDLDEMRTDK